MSQTGSELSMPDEDAVNPAENPGRSGSTDGSTVGRPRPAQQTGAVSDDQAGMWPQITMEEVLRSENMKAAYHRVKDNKGCPGIDRMTVDELGPALQAQWEVIRKELLEDRYQPQLVLKVEIPKPDGGGTRSLGIPTVIDRLIQQAILQVLQPMASNDGCRPSMPRVAAPFCWPR